MGGVFKSSSPAPAPAPKAEPTPSPQPASTGKTEDQAARRRARRSARALLSESRINPEEGISTLGQTGL